MITITPNAIKALQLRLVKRGTPDAAIRLGIKGGDCAGFNYVLMFEDDAPKDKDIQLDLKGVKIFIDKKSALLLDTATLEYKKSLTDEGFNFINSKETSRCGCGKSFSL